MKYRNLLIETKDNIMQIKIQREPVNALNLECYIELQNVISEVNKSNDIRVVILTGFSKYFVAGSDVTEFKTITPQDRIKVIQNTLISIYKCKVPVIAAVNGFALGAGVAIAVSCDIIIASEKSVFGMPEIDYGVLGSSSHLQRLVSPMKARMMVYTGKRLSAKEIYQYGSIELVVEHALLAEKSWEYAKLIAQKSPKAIQIAKNNLNQIEQMTLLEGFHLEQELNSELFE